MAAGVFLVACGAPEAAPAELGSLSRFFFREHDSAGDALLTEGTVSLSALLEDIDLEGEREGRSYSLPLLVEGDVADISRPDRALEGCIGLGLAAQSTWSVADHASYQVLTDLTEASPQTTSFLRSFEEPDPTCFLDQGCAVLRTTNVVVRHSALATITTELSKDYRWVETDAGLAMVARGWFTTSAHDEADRNHIWQHYEVDLFLPDGDQTRRFLGIWTEPDYAAIDEDTAGSFLLKGADETIAHVDGWLAE